MNKATITNFIQFQLAWLVCVLAGTSPWHVLGTVVIAAVVIAHLWQANPARQELKLILLALGLGLVWESLMVSFDVTRYQFGQVHPMIAPHWIIAMWALFATTLNVSMRWLKKSIALAALFGAIGGPLAFLAGEKLGAVSFGQTTQSLIVLALGWGALTPLLVLASKRFDGFAHEDKKPTDNNQAKQA